MLSDYMSELYTPFEQNLAITWANAHFSSWYQANQNASYEEQQKPSSTASKAIYLSPWSSESKIPDAFLASFDLIC